jgi:small subunit ribosomal protein S1
MPTDRDDDPRRPEDADPEDDFARMLEDSLAPKSYREGDAVEGTVVAIAAEAAFVDIGGKGEATIALDELSDPDDPDAPRVKVGDTVKAIVVSTEGGLRLSHRLARGAATRQRLIDAFRAGIPVEGRVEKAIKGGYEVRVAGQRAFCPISQIDAGFTSDPAAHVGKTYTFRLIECKEDGKNLVVSRRVLLQEEKDAETAAVRRAVVPGASRRWSRSAPSSISAPASRGSCTSPKWAGRAWRARTTSCAPATRSP